MSGIQYARVSDLISRGNYVAALSEASVPDVGMYWPDERAESSERNQKEALHMIVLRESLLRRSSPPAPSEAP